MREQDLLVQRFLDDDLAPEERVTFLKAVDADPSLRRRWLNLELVVAEAAQLPRLAPSARFLAQVQGKLALAPPSLWDRLRAMVTVPRTLEWNFAGAMVAASVVLVAVAGLLQFAPERIVEVPVPVTGGKHRQHHLRQDKRARCMCGSYCFSPMPGLFR